MVANVNKLCLNQCSWVCLYFNLSMLHNLVSLSFSSSKRKKETRQAFFRRQTQLCSDKIIGFIPTKSSTLQRQNHPFAPTKSSTLHQQNRQRCNDKTNFAATKSSSLHRQNRQLCSDKTNLEVTKNINFAPTKSTLICLRAAACFGSDKRFAAAAREQA